ncbi:lymphocyte function-associated antigen 3 isoform X3 [Pithys albifrons albifrons]|uniref:lymphocyte function-associated antigen 3 isoform X3 n=1 Tax=Pithys albifrons albifrons TaxID=3385563 RepID=UPI003A5CBE6A
MRLLLSFLCFAPLLAHIHSEDQLFGIVGETFTFPVEIKQNIEEITWKKNKDKVAEWEGQNTPIYFTPLRNRSTLKKNGHLTIYNLEKNDAGTYELHYWDSQNEYNLKFILDVLDPPSEPKINWNIEGDNLVLNCTSDFKMPLNYTWKLTNDPQSHQSQEFSIPVKNVDATKNATCFITFSQTEKSSEISLFECISGKKGYNSDKRNRILIVIPVFFMLAVGVVLFLWVRDGNKCERGSCAQNSPGVPLEARGSGECEQLFSRDHQAQLDSNRDKDNSALKGVKSVNNGVNPEEPSAMQNSIQTSECAGDLSITEEEVTQGAEGGHGEHLNNCLKCNTEDLKCFSDQMMEERL